MEFLSALTDPLRLARSTYSGMVSVPSAMFEPTGTDLYGEVEMMRMDSQVAASLALLKHTILDLPINLKGPEASVKLVQEVYVERMFGRGGRAMLEALEYGWAVPELTYRIDDGRWTIASIESRDRRNFAYDRDGRLLVRLDATVRPSWLASRAVVNGEWVPVPPLKFAVHRNGATQERPYGQSILAACQADWMAKWTVQRLAVRLAEKFSIPSVVALMDAGSDADLAKISGDLASLESSMGIAIAGAKDVKSLDVSGKLTELCEFIRQKDDAIAKAIMGQTMAMENGGGTGSYALATVHQATLAAMASVYASELYEALTATVVRWICELNGQPPARIELKVQPLTYQILLETIKAGVPVSKSAFYEITGIPAPKSDLDTLVMLTQAGVNPLGLQLSDRMAEYLLL